MTRTSTKPKSGLKRRRFAYKTVHETLQMYDTDFNAMGKKGWELIQVTQGGYGDWTALYKREIV